jgi:hypothetical protein
MVLNSNLKWEHIDLTYNFSVSYALMGLMLIVVAEIFKIGLSLEEEKQFTI